MAGTHFLDLSEMAVARLNELGGGAAVREFSELPFDDGRFDLVSAFDVIEQSAVFGTQPNNPRVLEHGVRMLTERRGRAMRWFNRLFMPLGLFSRKAPEIRARFNAYARRA